MSPTPTTTRLLLIAALACAAGCRSTELAPEVTLMQVPGHDSVPQDTSHKESPQLIPAENYMRSYLMIFGGMSAIRAQQELIASGSGLFDGWNAYLGALGLPSYALDLPRKGETNALMMATFERLGIALCNRAVEKDLKANPAVPAQRRMVYAFEVPKDPVDLAGFTPRFDLMHRTFLSYPAKLAPTDRTAAFFKLYQDTAAKHDAKVSRFTPTEAGWAAVCSGLVRHPEFHLN